METVSGREAKSNRRLKRDQDRGSDPSSFLKVQTAIEGNGKRGVVTLLGSNNLRQTDGIKSATRADTGRMGEDTGAWAEMRRKLRPKVGGEEGYGQRLRCTALGAFLLSKIHTAKPTAYHLLIH